MIPILTSDEDVPRQAVEHHGPRGFVCPGYFVTNPRTGEKMHRSDTLAATTIINGKSTAEFAAGLYDEGRRYNPHLPARCATCAFRRGTEANHSIASVGDALDAITNGTTFHCHENIRIMSDDCDHICHGFQAINNSPVAAWIRSVRRTSNATQP